MKKILTFLLMAMMVLPLSAKQTPKAWNFTVNDEGECVVTRTFPTSKDGAAALKAVKAVINKQTFEKRKMESEDAGKSLSYSIKKNTKSRYNPFAGNFNEAMEFTLDVRYEDGQVVLVFSNMVLENRYLGYGERVENDSFAGKIGLYEEAEQKAATASGKAKKEAVEQMETINDSLNMCEEELNKFIDAIKNAL